MEAGNLSSEDGFLIVGFSDIPEMQVPLFLVLLLSYLMTLVGNLLIMATVYCNSHLHSPMYFFLTNLSLIDVCYTSVIFPEMLAHFFQEGTHMSLMQCLLQVYFFIDLLVVEILVLAVMAYDRYVAICNPLRYMTIMNRAVCMRLAFGIWAISLMLPTQYTFLVSELSFCRSHTINHFFCDVTGLLKLSCSSTHKIETLTYIMGATIPVMSFILIITSYINITSCILKIKSKGGRHKAFSTCASHLFVVILFFRTSCSMYMRPATTYSTKENKILSLSYIAVTPLCNPIIYSLKNTEVKNALKKLPLH
ncbi:olfactory receptor 1G1-like [Ambystoma mexicanum]|uniref:olfactory receptor 1G1-like n=1 Tax=Ambystoma mexicanum TaxID=8296 RepID=UPI0037E7CDF0